MPDEEFGIPVLIGYRAVRLLTGNEFSKHHCWKIIREAKNKYQRNYSPKGKCWAKTMAKYLDCSEQEVINAQKLATEQMIKEKAPSSN